MNLATTLQIGIIVFLGYLSVYSLIDRICKCYEHTHGYVNKNDE